MSLDGTIAGLAGALDAAIGANVEGEGLISPFACGLEAAWACEDFDILAPRSLIAIADHFCGTQVLSRPEACIQLGARNLPNLVESDTTCVRLPVYPHLARSSFWRALLKMLQGAA
ncbi:hypothetical protein LB523_28485 [Mesorhizobium sp. ESP-6-4]|nr:hypothetical protein [Mesorhizobium sp. ESP-6-4]MBZ9662990.1 hypothetical protein [Mesorhizobium sp. ESP-6-4]